MTDNLRSKASARYNDVRGKAEQALATGKTKAHDALEAGKVRAKETAAVTREKAKVAAQTTSQQLDSNPLAAIAGGLAIGAIIAAALPRTARETKIAGPVGRSVRKTAKAAAKVDGDVAKAELFALGLTSDAARQTARELAGKIGKAATTAGTAAAKTIRKGKE